MFICLGLIAFYSVYMLCMKEDGISDKNWSLIVMAFLSGYLFSDLTLDLFSKLVYPKWAIYFRRAFMVLCILDMVTIAIQIFMNHTDDNFYNF